MGRRMTLFHGTPESPLQCVIDSDYLEGFESLGFVTSVDLIPKQKPATVQPTTVQKPKASGGRNANLKK